MFADVVDATSYFRDISKNESTGSVSVHDQPFNGRMVSLINVTHRDTFN
jgi:hypothetical protein